MMVMMVCVRVDGDGWCDHHVDGYATLTLFENHGVGGGGGAHTHTDTHPFWINGLLA